MRRMYSLALVTAVSASVTVSVTMPAVADQGIEKAMARSVTPRHPGLHAGRRPVVRARSTTQIAAIPVNAACSAPWCGREFVLMLGIGF